jgi:type III pantothenate kinase
MDINLLVLNVGNSRLAVGTFSRGQLEYSNRIPLSQRADWSGRIAEAWSRIADCDDAEIAAAAVNAPMIESVEHAVHQATGKSIQWVGREIDLPIKVLTEDPTRTGVDRILNVAAAYEQMRKACVVVDAGTAITIDCCNDQGEFLGGAIAAGVGICLDGLHQRAAALPKVELQAPTQVFGLSTQQAILNGIHHGVRGMVKELVENYATELGHWPDIIATGGDAAKLFEGWEMVHAIAPDLTLYGIALAYAEHHIKHRT